MIIKEAKFKKVRKVITQRVSDEVYGCDHCRKEINDYPNETSRLYLTIFHQSNESEHKHFCSWGCVIKFLPTIKTDYFVSLPHLMFDQKSKDIKELLKVLKPVLKKSKQG